MVQANPQAVGEGQMQEVRLGRGRHGHFQNVGTAYASKPNGSGLVQRAVQFRATVLEVVIGGAGIED